MNIISKAIILSFLLPASVCAQHIEGFGEMAVMNSNSCWKSSHPHLLVGVSHTWGNGWGVAGECECADDMEVTQLFIEKALCQQAIIRIGKMTAPIGMANLHNNPVEHFAVTLPTEEEAVLPAVSNMAGVSLAGQAGTWNYEMQGLLHNDSLAIVIRVVKAVTDNLKIGFSGFYDGKLIAGTDINHQMGAVKTRGIATYSHDRKAVHVGVETGYGILAKVVAFARYDFTNLSGASHRATFGMNILPSSHIILKAEMSLCKQKATANTEFALGIGVAMLLK